MANVEDRRNQSYITYDPELILFVLIMKNVSGIIRINRMIKDFNKDKVIDNIERVLGYEALEEIPYYDTVNNFLKKLEALDLKMIWMA